MKKRQKDKVILIVIILLLFHSLMNSHILNKSAFVRKDDDASRVFEGTIFYQRLINHEYKNLARDFYILPSPSHPKVFPLIGGLVLTFLDKVGLKGINRMILITNGLFLFILLISVFKIGDMLYSRKVGLLSAILLSFSLAVFSHSRISMLDLPLTAMLSLCFLSLLKTDNLVSLFFSLTTGVLFSLAQLTKETAIIFILPVFLYYSFRSFRALKEKEKQKIMNFIIIVLFFSILTGMVYLNPANKGVFRTYWGKSFLINNNGSDIFYYIRNLPLLSLGIIFSIALSPLVLSYIFNIRKRNIFLTLWFFVPILIFSVSSNKISRFIMPALPPLFLLLSSELFNPFFLNVRKLYAAILVSSSFFQYMAFNFFPPFALYPSPSQARLLYDNNFQIGLLSERHDGDHRLIRELIDILKKEKAMAGRENKIIPTFRLDMRIALEYEFKIRNMPFFISCPQSRRDIVDALPDGAIDWKKYLLTADYVIHDTGSSIENGHAENISRAFKESLEENLRFFKEVTCLKRPGGDLILVYKNLKK